MSKTSKALLTLLALALVRLPVAHLLTVMLPDASVNPVPHCIGGMLAALLLLGLPAWLLRPWKSPRLMPAKSPWGWMLAAVAAALLLRAAMAPVDRAWQAWLHLTPDALPAPETLPVAIVYVVALAAAPAVTEEAFFRGSLLTGLLDGSRRITAVLLTTLTFALMHGNAANFPSLLVVSLLLTLLMLRTGHIAVPMAAHFVYNLTALLPLAIPAGMAAVSVAALLIVLCRLPKVAHPPMKRTDGLMALAAIAVLILPYFI